jgi:hypothetical protein
MGGKAEEARVLREEARQLREEVTGKKRLEILLQDMREKLHHLGRRKLGSYIWREVFQIQIRVLGSESFIIIGTVRPCPPIDPDLAPDPKFTCSLQIIEKRPKYPWYM